MLEVSFDIVVVVQLYRYGRGRSRYCAGCSSCSRCDCRGRSRILEVAATVALHQTPPMLDRLHVRSLALLGQFLREHVCDGVLITRVVIGHRGCRCSRCPYCFRFDAAGVKVLSDTPIATGG